MIQGLSSFLPVMALCPQPNERVLDMAAAPAGKPIFILYLCMLTFRKDNSYCIINEKHGNPICKWRERKSFLICLQLSSYCFQTSRCKAIIGNLHRMGVNNTVVSNLDGAEYAKIQPQSFDRVLLDAPCSGKLIFILHLWILTFRKRSYMERRKC